MATDEMPDDWRTANVVPLFKKDRRLRPEVTKYIDEGSAVDVIYGVFRKAFDKVPQERLAQKFEDDTKVGDVVDRDEDGLRLVNWVEQWQMENDPNKCKVLHFGRSNKGRMYTMN
eukprot:g27347.t1